MEKHTSGASAPKTAQLRLLHYIRCDGYRDVEIDTFTKNHIKGQSARKDNHAGLNVSLPTVKVSDNSA